MSNEVNFTVSEFIEVCNQSLEYSFAGVFVEGEVASFKVNQGKWVFFDLKEGDASVNCFMTVRQLSTPLVDGMKIRVCAIPKVTRWGKFSLTVQQFMPVGEGSIKKSFELLKKKLTAEGLFDPNRKRTLPAQITKIAVISSVNAAGYIDFLKILENRWGGLQIKTVNTQVQGMAAPAQIIRALQYFNERGDFDVIAILRGGGSADDLAAFNDEQLARAIAASKIIVITGVGHEIDETLADLAADVRASTPSNAAERLVPDRQAIKQQISLRLADVQRFLLDKLAQARQENAAKLQDVKDVILRQIDTQLYRIQETNKTLASLNPEMVLKRGYAILGGAKNVNYSVGDVVKITTFTQELTMEVQNAQNRIRSN